MVHADTSRTGLPVGNSGRSQPKKKRAYHNKVRTGCKTCKIRRIRCDEGKPSCKRCLTTGRKCDGYGTGPSYPMPSSTAEDEVYLSNYLDLGADLALGGMVKCPEELRSYRFFMEVTASSLAGALQTDFWLLEVPRVCHYDKAIWHATVSLGSSHEAYVSGRPSSNKTNPFSLKHFNLAIGALMKNGSASEWWRALTVSTIFTCICVLEGQLEQSRLHFKSGCKLLRSLEAAMLQPMKESDGTEAAVVLAGSQMPSSPVSLSSVRSMLICFELVEAKMDPKLTSAPPSLLSDNDKYCAWRSYSVPWSSAFGRFLTSRNLSDAILSAESLFMALAIASFGHAKAVKERYAKEGFNNFHIDDVDETDHHRGFKEIQKALDLFRAELEGTPGPSMRPAELLELKKAYLSLRVIHSASRLFLVEDPDEPDPKRRIASLPDLCTSIVDLAEKVFGLETTVGCLRSGGPVSSPTIMNPLVAVVKCGVGSATRERAIRLLYMPRLEGVWDSRMAACMGERILTRERTATIEYSQQEEMNSITINNPLARGWNKEDGHDDDIHPLARTCNSSMMYVSGREMRFIARTWKEWLEDKQGEETRIFW